MGAPTVSGEDTLKETMEEYGVTAAELGLEAESDDDAEQALLARFLFEPPKRQAVTGERNGLALDRVVKQLTAFLRMISGHAFTVAYSDPPATDNLNVYLPRAVPAPEAPELDLLLYRAMGLVQVGFIRHGVLRERAILAEIHRDWVLRSCYHLLAARYVLRKWAEEYPGLRDDLRRVALLEKAGQMRVNFTPVPRDGMPGAFVPLYEGLATCLNWREPGPEGDPARAAVRVVDRLDLPGAGGGPPATPPLAPRGPDAVTAVLLREARTLREHFRKLRLGPPPLPWFLGIIRPEWILADLARDIAYEQEWKKGNKPLRQLYEAMARNKGAGALPTPPAPEAPKQGFRARLLAKLAGPDTSNAPAYGRLRDEHVEQQRAAAAPRAEDELATPPKPGEDGAREYDEWDDAAGAYRFAAVKVQEVEAATGPLGGYERIVQANQRQIKEIRRKFEALRVEERWLHGQPDGTELDLNRAVQAMTDLAAGQQPDDRVYKRFVRSRETVAILTLVDLSGSTQGHVIHLEQEALVLFAEGLKTLAFPHAFYGFGNTHPAECHLHRIKGFDEPYGEPVYKRMGNLRANGATRLGAYLRHAGWLLANRPQSRRVLMVVSDGKPEDRGEYRGKQGLRDTAMAVAEVRRLGVHVHGISLDAAEGADAWLKEVFGAGRYLKLDAVDSLPVRLPEVFRGLVR
ncbi:MAG: nitric oxide reductase activation protein NorD [Myxococcota bacterium]